MFKTYAKDCLNLYTVLKFDNISFMLYSSEYVTIFCRLIDRIKIHTKPIAASQSYIAASAKTITAYIADDDIDDRSLFADAINEISKQIVVKGLESGFELMNELLKPKHKLPDIIFLDLNMPGKSGKDCLKEIKKNDKFNKVLIVIYFTSVSEKDINDTYNSGANFYIKKPNTYNDLIVVLKKIMTQDINKNYTQVSKNDYLMKSDIN